MSFLLPGHLDTPGMPPASGTPPIRSHEEYRKLRAMWPFDMPQGYVLPQESRHPDEPDGPEHRLALAELYFTWRGATATAAYAAHLRGDDNSARKYLDNILSVGSDRISRMLIDDPLGEYSSLVIRPAMHGDYAMLKAFDIDQFLADEELAGIASRAGDF